MNRSPLPSIAALLVAAFSTSLTPLSQAASLVDVTQKKSGKTIQVEIIKLTDDKLTFKSASGKSYTVGTDTITVDSLKQIKTQLETQPTESTEVYGKINKAVSHPLFQGAGSLWNQPAVDIAQRLKWPEESKTDQSSSFRLYTPLTYQFLGAHPYSAALYGGKDGNASHLSLVFANKGDYGSAAGFGEDHFKKVHPDTAPPGTLEEAIEVDASLIAASLTECLGAPVKQYYGEKEDRRKVLRWNMGVHAFLLSELEEEYTSLLIVPKANADLAGKVAFVKDSDLRQIVGRNVVKSDNGDVLIKNIPMVNQGPKGYCAPGWLLAACRT